MVYADCYVELRKREGEKNWEEDGRGDDGGDEE
jgi:hypothetical protein